MSSNATDQWPAEANVGEPWVDKFGGVRQPAVMYEADDGTVTYGQDSIQALMRDIDRVQASRRVLRRPAPRRAVATPRRTNTSSGRPRAQATRSSSRSGDSPDEDGPAPPANFANGEIAISGVAR